MGLFFRAAMMPLRMTTSTMRGMSRTANGLARTASAAGRVSRYSGGRGSVRPLHTSTEQRRYQLATCNGCWRALQASRVTRRWESCGYHRKLWRWQGQPMDPPLQRPTLPAPVAQAAPTDDPPPNDPEQYDWGTIIPLATLAFAVLLYTLMAQSVGVALVLIPVGLALAVGPYWVQRQRVERARSTRLSAEREKQEAATAAQLMADAEPRTIEDQFGTCPNCATIDYHIISKIDGTSATRNCAHCLKDWTINHADPTPPTVHQPNSQPEPAAASSEPRPVPASTDSGAKDLREAFISWRDGGGRQFLTDFSKLTKLIRDTVVNKNYAAARAGCISLDATARKAQMYPPVPDAELQHYWSGYIDALLRYAQGESRVFSTHSTPRRCARPERKASSPGNLCTSSPPGSMNLKQRISPRHE